MDGPLMLSETIEWYKKKRKKLLIFKIDFEKTYDSVSWDFLIAMMLKMGFSRNWCNWILMCLSSARTSILINGSPTKEFPLKRGLRQGDPLSPFLFLIIMEGLHLLLKEKVDARSIKGARVGNEDTLISHLFYADDAVVVSDWDKSDTELVSVTHPHRALSFCLYLLN
ncbi:secreted RxLR effector protein 78-like [Rutidosis leptorrhynchoides]|uniref:secreted RxLR effector protein 78-like n=1 Tax=Rutidosis leptorrhynchoides TaxID=125765 RepID=UPI003A9A05C4